MEKVIRFSAMNTVTFKPYAHLAVFDYDLLVERLMGDGDITQLILNAFMTNIGPRLNQLTEQVNCRDLPALLKNIHVIKGAAGNVSALALHQMTIDLEKAGRTADLTEIGRLTELITSHYDTQLRPLIERQTGVPAL